MNALDVKGLAGSAPLAVESSIPEPPTRWKTRVLLPTVVAGIALLLVGVSAWESLWPATPVTVVPVMVKSTTEGRVGESTVVASGWVEPDPFSYYVSALAPGVVEELRVLEGESVTAGQVVARLVADDAELLLVSAESELELREAELELARADLVASRETIENLVDRRQAVKGNEARVRELEAPFITRSRHGSGVRTDCT